MSAIAQALESLVGATGGCSWESLDEKMRVRLGAAIAPPHLLECIVYPETQDQLAEVMGCLHRLGARSIFLGSGSKLRWGGLAEGIQVAVSTARLNRLIDHADGDLTVTAEAGLRLAELQTVLGQKGQFLAIDPSYSNEATLGGIIATADAGPLRHRYGGVRDMLIGIQFVRADGQIAKAGGRVVKNVAGYDLMKLFTGSWGTLGGLSQVTFRVYPLPEASETVVLTGETAPLAQTVQTLLSSALTPTACELVAAPTLKGLGWGDRSGILVRFQSIAVGVQKQAERLVQVGQTLGLTANRLVGEPETALWKQLQETWESDSNTPGITCKIGVLPSNAVITLDKLLHLLPALQFGSIHLGSGLGTLRFPLDAAPVATLLDLRRLCQSQDGFLSILEAPESIKQKVEVWGYAGNALHLMQGIKQQFDPQRLLSPARFVGGL